MKTDNDIHADAVAAGEPTFTLVAHDALAPDIVEQWARMAERVGVAPEKVARARTRAQLMTAWQKSNPDLTRFPD